MPITQSFKLLPAVWRQALPWLGLLLLTTLLLFQDTAVAIGSLWYRSDTFTHGFLVPPLVLWLVWRKRQTLMLGAPQPSRWGLLLMAGVGLAWLLGDLVAVNAVTQLALISMLVLLVPTVLGFAVTRLILFPLAFLFFAVPLGEFAMPQLMVWTADFTVFALRLSGIPVLREGLQFVIPSGSWSVIEACSGVRYLIASLTLGTLFAYLNYQSLSRRVLFIGVSVVVPILANWLRAYMIVMLGHLSGNQLAAGVDHLIYGWVFFGIVILLMFMVGARWAEPEPDVIADANDAASMVEAVESGKAAPASYWRAHRVHVLVLLVVLAWPLAARWVIQAADSTKTPIVLLPAFLSPVWTSGLGAVTGFEPDFQNPSASVNATYYNQTTQVGLYLGYYRQQNYERKLVSSSNVLVSSSDPLWAQVTRGTRDVDFAGQPMQVRTAELRGAAMQAQQRLQVWQIYWVNGTWTSSDTLAKLYGALYRLLGRGDDAAVLILYTPKMDASDADATLAAFVQANLPTLLILLQQTKAQR